MNHKIKVLQVAAVDITVRMFLLPFIDRLMEGRPLVNGKPDEKAKK